MKKGTMAFQDVTWILFFVLGAIFMYFILFKPLEGKMENKLNMETLETDADFIAMTLPQRIVNTPDLAGKRSIYNGKEFPFLLNELIKEYKKDPGNYDEGDTYKDYKAFMKSSIDSEVMRETRPEREQMRPLSKSPSGYAVLLMQNGVYIEESCVGSDQNARDFCLLFDSEGERESTDPATGVKQPDLVGNSDTNEALLSGGDYQYDVGVSYVPTEQGVITVEVVMRYWVESK